MTPKDLLSLFRSAFFGQDRNALAELRSLNGADRQTLLAEISAEELSRTPGALTLPPDWYAEVLDTLFGPEPHPPDDDDEFKAIADVLEQQEISSGELLRELLDSDDLPDSIRSLHSWLSGLRNVQPEMRHKLSSHISNKEAGSALPALLARYGLTPIAVVRAAAAIGDALVRHRLANSSGSLRAGVEVLLSCEGEPGSDEVTVRQCAVEVAQALSCPNDVSENLTRWLLAVVPFRPLLIPDWEHVPDPSGGTLRFRLSQAWSTSHLDPPPLEPRWRHATAISRS